MLLCVPSYIYSELPAIFVLYGSRSTLASMSLNMQFELDVDYIAKTGPFPLTLRCPFGKVSGKATSFPLKATSSSS